jgi:hypothetical protein
MIPLDSAFAEWRIRKCGVLKGVAPPGAQLSGEGTEGLVEFFGAVIRRHGSEISRKEKKFPAAQAVSGCQRVFSPSRSNKDYCRHECYLADGGCRKNPIAGFL